MVMVIADALEMSTMYIPYVLENGKNGMGCEHRFCL